MWYIWDNSFWRYFTWTEENVMSFSVKDLEKYKDSLYTKNNLIIVIAWKNADSDFIKEQISLKFAELKEKRELELPKYVEQMPDCHRKIIDKWLKQVQLMMSAKWFTEMDTKAYTADVLSSLLWWGRASLLKSVIREQESLCYDISCNHSCSSDFWYFRIVSWLDNDKLEYWLDKINDVIWSIAKGDITEDSFNDAVWFNIWRCSLDIQTPFAIAKFVWRHYLLYKEVITIEI